MRTAVGYPAETAQAAMECTCNRAKIRAINAYLKEYFPEYTLRDFHAPTRLMHAGLPIPSAEHHVVSLTRDDVLPYHAVFLSEFQEQSLDDVYKHLREWKVAEVLLLYRIAIVSKQGASSL